MTNRKNNYMCNYNYNIADDRLTGIYVLKFMHTLNFMHIINLTNRGLGGSIASYLATAISN